MVQVRGMSTQGDPPPTSDEELSLDSDTVVSKSISVEKTFSTEGHQVQTTDAPGNYDTSC